MSLFSLKIGKFSFIEFLSIFFCFSVLQVLSFTSCILFQVRQRRISVFGAVRSLFWTKVGLCLPFKLTKPSVKHKGNLNIFLFFVFFVVFRSMFTVLISKIHFSTLILFHTNTILSLSGRKKQESFFFFSFQFSL